MMIDYFNRHKRILFSITSLILTCLTFIPFFKSGIYRGADLQYHLSRLDGIVEAIFDGQFPIAIYPNKNFGFAYPSPLFYCDIFLILPALIRYCLNIPLVTMYKIIIFLIIYLTSYSAIYFTYDIFNNYKSSLLAAILFLFSNYYLTDMYVRMALGELMALTFSPLLIWSIYKFIFGGKDNSLILGISFTCMLCCHNICFFLYVVLFCILLVINIKRVFNKNKIISLFKACLIGTCLGAFFLLPMYEQFRTNDFMLNHVSNYSLSETALSIKQLFTDLLFQLSKGGIITVDNDKTIGLLIIILPLFGMFTFKNNNKYTNQLLVIAYVFILLTTKYIPLYKIIFLEKIQFTSRLYLISIPLLSFVVSDIYSNTKYTHLIVITVLLLSLFNTSYLYKEVTNKELNVIIDENSTSNDLFIERKYAEHDLEYIKWNLEEVENGEYLVYHPNFNYYTHSNKITGIYDFEIAGEYSRQLSKSIVKTNFLTDTSVVLPVTWYRGYSAYEIDNNGNVIKEIEVGIERLSSRVMIVAESGEHTYTIKYTGTKIQKASTYLSLTSFIIISVYCLYKHLKNKSI